MKIRHKNSQEVFERFPSWTKLNGSYGYLVFTHDFKVFFFTPDDTVGLACEDITDEFEVMIMTIEMK